ncbi:hypothetical protein PTTG_08399, partial [Puccinia triticina 1-1 BBBD Race 1]
MAQQVRFFVRKVEVKDVLETLDGYDPPVWTSLKAAMLAYWGQVDTARFTLPDLETLAQSWIAKGGVSSVQANDVMRKIEQDRRPKAPAASEKPPATIDDISQMLQSFEQRLEKKYGAQPPQSSGKVPPAERGPLVCYYCHREGHGTGRCFELKKDKEANLVEQKGNNFFLPNGALIPFDSSRPIRHVVASFQPPPTASVVTPEFRATCGSLNPWYPPAVTSQSFSGSYEADPARKKHEAPKPYKAPAVPPS